MKKKDLISQNSSLFFKNDELQGKYNKLKAENESLKAKNVELIKEAESIKAELESHKATPNLPERIEYSFPQELNFAAKIIGEIVVEATMKCNSITRDINTENRELVNLILGRTEVAKAEILKITALDLTEEDKKAKIDNEKTNALDYFLSVLAQKA